MKCGMVFQLYAFLNLHIYALFVSRYGQRVQNSKINESLKCECRRQPYPEANSFSIANVRIINAIPYLDKRVRGGKFYFHLSYERRSRKLCFQERYILLRFWCAPKTKSPYRDKREDVKVHFHNLRAKSREASPTGPVHRVVILLALP